MSAYHTGGCYCGKVRYQISGKIRSAVYCHCGQCRHMMGLYMAASAAPLENFELTSEATLKWFGSSEQAERGFCSDCGTPMFWRAKNGSTISFTIGSLDNSDHLKPAGHIFVSDKAEWYELHDGLPQFDQGDDGSLRQAIYDPA